MTCRLGRLLGEKSPGPGDPRTGLVDRPLATYSVATRGNRVDEQSREPQYPPLQDHAVDLDAACGERFRQVPVGQSVAQVPAHGQQDDLRREPEPGERWLRRPDGSIDVSALRNCNVTCHRARARTCSGRAASRSTPRCPPHHQSMEQSTADLYAGSAAVCDQSPRRALSQGCRFQNDAGLPVLAYLARFDSSFPVATAAARK